MRVLHVSEAMGGGVTSAVTAMVEATPEIDHHLLAKPRPQHDTGVDPEGFFTTVHPMSGNPALAVRDLRTLVKELFPDVVHAHSSVAGVVVRMAGLDRTHVVYSPHCFAFERRDISGPVRKAFWTIERALAPRTDLFLAVAPQEMDLAAELGHRALAYVPNRSAEIGTSAESLLAPDPVEPGSATFRSPVRIVTVGRVCAQKDWRYLVHLKRYLDDHSDLDATWEWLGDGDPEGERALREVGVEVSGWIERSEVLARLADAQVYVHTAAWEAAPISILEAADLGLPLAIRSIPSLDSLALPGLAAGVADLADRIVALTDERAWDAGRLASLALNDRHSIEVQGRQLVRAYDRVLSGSTAGVTVLSARAAAGGGVVLPDTGLSKTGTSR